MVGTILGIPFRKYIGKVLPTSLGGNRKHAKIITMVYTKIILNCVSVYHVCLVSDVQEIDELSCI